MLARSLIQRSVKRKLVICGPAARQLASAASGRAANDSSKVQIRNVLIYDGVCNLCNVGVSFILPRTSSELKFCAAQTKKGAHVLENLNISLDDVMKQFAYVDGKGKVHRASTAALKVAKEKMKWPWPIASVFLVIPAVLRDAVYDVVAKHRYQMFGRTDACQVPAKDIQDRFLM